jgi:hypothetical protein
MFQGVDISIPHSQPIGKINVCLFRLNLSPNITIEPNIDQSYY